MKLGLLLFVVFGLIAESALALTADKFTLGMPEAKAIAAMPGKADCKKNDPKPGQKSCGSANIPSSDPKVKLWGKADFQIATMDTIFTQGKLSFLSVEFDAGEVTLKDLKKRLAFLTEKLGEPSDCPLKEIKDGASILKLHDATCEWTEKAQKAVYRASGDRFILNLSEI